MRFVVLVAAGALVVLFPAKMQTAPATRIPFQLTRLECVGPTDAGFVRLEVEALQSSDTFALLEFWATGTEPFESDPTWIDASNVVSGDETGFGGTLGLVEFDPQASPPFGAPVGTATFGATFTPDGAPTRVDDRFRSGNTWETATGTFQPLAVEGVLSLPNGDTLDLSLCSATHEDLTLFDTNPAAFSLHRPSEFRVECFWQDGDRDIFLVASEDESGPFGFVFVGDPDRSVDGSGDTTLTPTALELETGLFDLDTGDRVGSASATAVLAASGRRQRLINESAATVRKEFVLPHTVAGTLQLTLAGSTATYPMNGETCDAADLRVSFHEVFPGGPPPRPLANDTPDAAEPLRLGKRVRVVTGANDPDPEVPCLVGDEVGLGFTVWHTIEGTGDELTVDTAGSKLDTVVGVYRAAAGGFEQIACVDDVEEPDFSLSARVTWPTEEGVTYWIQVGNLGPAGRLEVVVH